MSHAACNYRKSRVRAVIIMSACPLENGQSRNEVTRDICAYCSRFECNIFKRSIILRVCPFFCVCFDFLRRILFNWGSELNGKPLQPERSLWGTHVIMYDLNWGKIITNMNSIMRRLETTFTTTWTRNEAFLTP